jgi:hypothetical protein
VESAINALEAHGLDRCPDHGLAGFQRYVALAQDTQAGANALLGMGRVGEAEAVEIMGRIHRGQKSTKEENAQIVNFLAAALAPPTTTACKHSEATSILTRGVAVVVEAVTFAGSSPDRAGGSQNLGGSAFCSHFSAARASTARPNSPAR